MQRSLRRRLAISLALLAGLTLAGFAALAWWSIRDARVERLHTELRLQLTREAPPQLRTASQWQQTVNTLAQSLAGGDRNKVLLIALGDAGEKRFWSAHTPDDFAAQTLPWPSAPALVPPPERQAPAIDDATGPRDAGPPEHFDRPLRIENPESPLPPGQRAAAGDSAAEPRDEHSPGRFDRPPPFLDRSGPEFDVRRPLLRNEPPRRRPSPRLLITEMKIPSGPWHVGLVVLPGSKMAIAVHQTVIDAEMAPIRRAYLVAIPFSLLLIGAGAWFLSGRALRPIARLTASIQGVTAKGLDQRVAATGLDREFENLIQVFNEMLERLQRSFTQASRFSADAAHELKTPLAILQGQVERAIGAAADGSPLQGSLTGILDEVQRLGTITRKLLLLAQVDAGHLRLHTTPLDLSALLQELSDDARMLAPSLKITTEITSGLMLRADRDLILQVLHNLLTNAIKYNIPNGWIRIIGRAGKGKIEIDVENISSDKLPPDRNKLFERFYRANAAHNRDVDGVGLGLSVSREIARAHGGDLEIRPSATNSVIFRLSLPKETAR